MKYYYQQGRRGTFFASISADAVMNGNAADQLLLGDVGIGLRILNDRSATGRVLHIDLAFPLNADPRIKSCQFLVKTKVNF